jgi:S1-C subfamily serine protease
MVRALLLGILVLAMSGAAAGQALSVLQVKVVLLDAARNPAPVPRHVLLISENPASATPRQVVTSLDGTAQIRLRPGNYTVESDRPVAFLGKSYQWTLTVDIAAGRDAVLELTADNAEIAPVATADTPSAGTPETDPAFLLSQWRDSVVGLWTPTTHASGFIVEASGLIVTNQRAIGAASSVEVQLSATVKVAGTVLAADAARDAAVLRIDPKAAASVRPVPVQCGPEPPAALADGQEIFTIGVPLRPPTRMTSGIARRATAQAIDADLVLPRGSAGGPVFAASGIVLGITSMMGEDDGSDGGNSRVVRIGQVCEVVAAAREKMKTSPAPDAAHLPLEPERPFPPEALAAASKGRAGSLNPYQVSTSTFDVNFITPVLIYGAQHPPVPAAKAGGTQATRPPEPPQTRPLMDFANWSEYVADYPPVLLVRVTPKMVEGFWTTVGRVAAQTQGVALPPLKRIKSGFGRLRAMCGDAEVVPIHPFRLEQRVSDSEAVYEGLYVFDPAALGPQCGTVKLILYSEKEPEKGETRVVDAAVIQRIWDDFAGYRAR